MENIEYKAELRDLPLAQTIVTRLGAKHVGQLFQVDTYYRLADGRLKKRETEGFPVEYIQYQRANAATARVSEFTIFTGSEAAVRFGTAEMEPWVVVRKLRDVYMHGRVRIHLDQVERLGTFVEFEALVSEDQDHAACHAAVAGLRRALGPVLGEPVSMSYSDLVALEGSLPPPSATPLG